MPSWRKTASWLLGFSAFALGSGLLVFGGSRQDVSAAPFAPIRLQGSGDDDIARELPVWNARLSTATRPTALNYFTQGSSSGRSQLLSGSVDFAVSGVPFTAAELAARPAGAAEIIEVPISVGSAAVVLTTPAGSGWSTFSPAPNCDPDDPDADPTTCAPIIGPFNGPWRIPANNLSAMITGLAPGFRGNGLTNWSHPDLVAAFGRSDLIVQAVASRHHTFVLRADITAQNQYLLEYARDLGPVAWGLAVESTPQFDWTAIGERLPSTVVTRFGVETQMGVIALANIDAATNATPDSWTGNGGPIPTTQVAALQASSPGAGLVVAEIQNARGEYVAPNRASLDAALVDPSQPSAYPLTYINRLFTVAGTLTPDEANALAASVRYIVTDGQDTMVEHGSTTLTTQLRDEALAKADQIVAANCTAEGYEVTAGGPSEFEPDSPLLGAIASMLHCTPRAGTPTTLPPLQRPRITGALSSFPARFISQWRFEVARPPYEIAVDSVTAGADLARSQYITGAADFATTETPFTPSQITELGQTTRSAFTTVPIAAGGIGLMFNLVDVDGMPVTDLNLTRRAACRIFTEPGMRWDDPEITASNPTLRLPGALVRPVVRSDEAGESDVMSDFCLTVAPDVWAAFVALRGEPIMENPQFSAGQRTPFWPQGWGNVAAALAADGVAAAIASSVFSIGFVESGDAAIRGLTNASLENGAGAFVAPTGKAVSRGLANATVSADGRFQFDFDSTDAAAYFPAMYSSVIVQTTGFDPAKGTELARFLCYAVSRGQRLELVTVVGYAQLSAAMIEVARDRIAQIPGAPPWDQCAVPDPSVPPVVVPEAPIAVLPAALAAIILAIVFARRHRTYPVTT